MAQSQNILSYSTGSERGFIPSDGRAQLAKWALIAAILLEVVGIAALVWDMSLLRRIDNGGDPAVMHDGTYDTVMLGEALLTFGAMVITAVLLLMWIYRAYGNLRPLGHTPRFKPGWAVGYWFVPIINLWRPYQIMKDLWLRSEGPPFQDGYDKAAAPGTITLWWGCWLGSGFLARFGQSKISLFVPGDDFDALYTGDTMMIVACVLAIIAGIQLLRIISRVVDAQRLAFSRVQAATAAPMPAAVAPTPVGSQ